MKNYVIFTDTGCDLHPDLLTKWQIPYLSLTFKFDHDDKEYQNTEMDTLTFYNKMKAGEVAKTSAINTARFRLAFEELLKKGLDVLCLSFSGGLSTTYNSARLAAEELKEDYPDNKVVVIDTLCASAGQGLILYLAKQKKAEGASLMEVAAYVTDLIPNLDHWFTVDDLVYLKRGGRVSPTAAFLGNTLGIKPILHVDDAGKLVSVSKIRGRKAAIKHLAEQYGALALDKANGTVFISHADCEEDANSLADILKENYGVSVSVITDIGPVIGAHAGPGTLALFFVGSKR